MSNKKRIITDIQGTIILLRSSLEDAVKEIEKRSTGNEYIAVCLKESNELIGELFNMHY